MDEDLIRYYGCVKCRCGVCKDEIFKQLDDVHVICLGCSNKEIKRVGATDKQLENMRNIFRYACNNEQREAVIKEFKKTLKNIMRRNTK